MATSKQIRNAIRAAGRTVGVDFTGKTTYTDRTRSGTYIGFPMPYGESGKAGALVTEANFLLFAACGEKDTIRVTQAKHRMWGQSGRAYIRATVTG